MPPRTVNEASVSYCALVWYECGLNAYSCLVSYQQARSADPPALAPQRESLLRYGTRTLHGLVLLLTVSLPLAAAAAGAHQPFDADALLAVRTITDVDISPDGNAILYVVAEADRTANRYRSYILKVPREGGVPLALTAEEGGSDSSPRWAPDGRRIAFLRERDGVPQLWSMQVDGKNAGALDTESLPVVSFEWAPDGKSIVYLAPDAPTGADAQPRTPVRLVDQSLARQHLHTVNVETGRSRRITSGAFAIESFSLSPDGRSLAVTRRPSLRTIDDYNTDVYVVGVADGTMRPLIERPGRDDTPKWSPDGRWIAFESTDGSLAEYANVDLFVVPAAGGTPRDVTPGFGERLYGFYGWTGDSQTLLFRARRGLTMQLFATDAAKGVVRPITGGDYVYDSFSVSRNGHARVAFVRTDTLHPKDLFVADLGNFEPRLLVSSNPDIGRYQGPRTQTVHWTGADGLNLEGLLARPAVCPPHGCPLLAYLHGGPSGGFTVGFAPQVSAIPVPLTLEAYPPQLFVARGYTVFMPNVRGGGGYGQSFRRANVGDWGGKDLADLLAGLDMLIKQGIADPERLGVMGWSYGGFLSAWAITQSDRFKAAVVGAGPTDLWSWYGTTDQPDQVEAYFGGPPWVNPGLYTARSATRAVERIHCPVLFQHSEHDEAVPLNQAEQLYRALKRRGVSTELAIYEGAGHDLTQPLQNLDVWRRALEWFDRWLAASEAH